MRDRVCRAGGLRVRTSGDTRSPPRGRSSRGRARASTSGRTLASDAPSATLRAAAIACVIGRALAIACIQSGSLSSGTLTPQKISSTAIVRLAMIGTSRMRKPIAAVSMPRPVHANDASRSRAAIAGHRRPGHPEAEQERAADESGCGGHRRVDEHRQRATEEERRTVRGRREHGGERLGPPLAVDREAHAEKRSERRGLHGVPDHEPRIGLEVRRASEIGEEEDLRRRPDQKGRDVDRRPDPREERAKADRASDEEDPQPGSHVSERVALSRARRSK